MKDGSGKKNPRKRRAGRTLRPAVVARPARFLMRGHLHRQPQRPRVLAVRLLAVHGVVLARLVPAERLPVVERRVVARVLAAQDEVFELLQLAVADDVPDAAVLVQLDERVPLLIVRVVRERAARAHPRRVREPGHGFEARGFVGRVGDVLARYEHVSAGVERLRRLRLRS